MGVPEFHDWVEYSFVTGPGRYTSPRDHQADEERDRFFELRPALEKAANYIRLFESPAFLADRFSRDQIADGTKFLLGSGHWCEWLGDVRSGDVPVDVQARCWRSIATYYTDLLDCVCSEPSNGDGSAPARSTWLDLVVTRIWDMNFVEGPLHFPRLWPHLVDPCIEVLEIVLSRCRTRACLASAMYAIQWCVKPARFSEHKDVTDRLLRVARSARERPGAPAWVVEWTDGIIDYIE